MVDATADDAVTSGDTAGGGVVEFIVEGTADGCIPRACRKKPVDGLSIALTIDKTEWFHDGTLDNPAANSWL